MGVHEERVVEPVSADDAISPGALTQLLARIAGGPAGAPPAPLLPGARAGRYAALKVKLLPGRAPATPRASNPEAYTHYLLGRQFFNRHTVDGFRRAREEFEAAIALDPAFAPAQAWLAASLRDLANHGTASAEESAAVRRRALAAADRAVALAPDLEDGYSTRGMLRTDWNHHLRQLGWNPGAIGTPLV